MEQFEFYKGIMKVVCLQCWMPIRSALLVESMGKFSPCFSKDKEKNLAKHRGWIKTIIKKKKQWIDKLTEMTWMSALIAYLTLSVHRTIS